MDNPEPSVQLRGQLFANRNNRLLAKQNEQSLKRNKNRSSLSREKQPGSFKRKRAIDALEFPPQARTYRCKPNMPWRPEKQKSLSDPAPTARHSESATHQIHSNAAPLPLFLRMRSRWPDGGLALPAWRDGCAERGNSRHRRISGYRCRYSAHSTFLTLSSSHVPSLIYYMLIFRQPAVEKTTTHQVFRRLPRNLPHTLRSKPSPSISETNSPVLVCEANPVS